MKKFLFSIIAALMAATLCGCASAPLRLHILANSDSEADQSTKLAVRDAVIGFTAEHSGEFSDMSGALAFVNANMGEIASVAGEVLRERGAGYGVRCKTGVFDFPERSYGSTVYPAGEYRALRVVLGRGEGHNWWCVIYPPLCITAAAAADEPVEYRSAIAEFFAGIFGGNDN